MKRYGSLLLVPALATLLATYRIRLVSLVAGQDGADATAPHALAELLLCLILFAACAAHVRLRLRYAPSAATDPS